MGRSSYGTDLLWRSIRYGWFGTVVLSSALLAKDYVVDAYSVTGSSMAPTLSPNSDTANEEDFVVISKLRFGGRVNNDGLERLSPGWDRIRASSLWRLNCNELRRGDIVTFWSPVSPNIGIKRVIALEGDTVIPEWRVKHGKGFRMVSPGAKNEGHALGGRPESLVVPYGHIWVEGDNRYDSQDSRDYGPVRWPF